MITLKKLKQVHASQILVDIPKPEEIGSDRVTSVQVKCGKRAGLITTGEKLDKALKCGGIITAIH